MDLNQALEQDNAAGSEVLTALEAIAEQLSLLGVKYPHTFAHLCEMASGTGEMTLQDSASAVGWALDYLAEGEE